MAGHTPISFGSPAATIPQVSDGRLRALVVGGAKRLRSLPDVPTMREAGYAQVECDAWVGVLAPAKTPRGHRHVASREIVKVVQIPEILDRLVSLGFEPAETTPAGTCRSNQVGAARWRNVVRTANIKAN